MRLNRFLASAGLGSRRSVETLVREERVRINGRVVTDLATKVEPTDVVKVGNRVLHEQHQMHAILNKPPGYVCSSEDEKDRRTIYELLPPNWPRVFHVGRLDMESEGMLVVTNDGDLSLALTHPRYKVDKEYDVTIDRPLDPAHREKLLRGFQIIGGRAKMEQVEMVTPQRIRAVLKQGIKRQIRLMLFDVGGYEVTNLKRVRIGSLTMKGLPIGEWRELTAAEVSLLKTPGPKLIPRRPLPPAKAKEQRPAAMPGKSRDEGRPPRASGRSMERPRRDGDRQDRGAKPGRTGSSKTWESRPRNGEPDKRRRFESATGETAPRPRRPVGRNQERPQGTWRRAQSDEGRPPAPKGRPVPGGAAAERRPFRRPEDNAKPARRPVGAPRVGREGGPRREGSSARRPDYREGGARASQSRRRDDVSSDRRAQRPPSAARSPGDRARQTSQPPRATASRAPKARSAEGRGPARRPGARRDRA